MTSVVWDAADVLQIYHHRRCIGITTRKTRCSLTIKEPRLSAIAPLLDRMSQNSPEFVTTQTLSQLADLCLCRTYHAGQVHRFVGHWTTVVKEAVSVERQRMAKRTEVMSQVQQTLDFQSHILKLQEDLSAARQANTQTQKQYQRDVKGLRDEIMHLEQQLKESEDHRSGTEGRLSATRRNLEKLQTQAMNDLIARNSLEMEKKSLKAQMIDAQKKLNDYVSVKEQNRDLDVQIKTFEKKIKQYTAMLEDTTNKANATEEQVATERAAKESMENRYKARLTEQEAEIAGLKSHREELEQTVAGLQASIKNCWWHRFRAWKERFRKRNRSGSWISITDEMNEDIALKAYA
jgi:predicted  nucleic acid-binding Zn-ribbon protein